MERKTMGVATKTRLAAMLLAATAAFTASAKTCITDVMVVGGSTSSITNSYAAQGWKVIKQDLNAGAKGDYIYLLYKSADSAIVSNGFITGFYIKTGAVTNELTHAGRVYSLAPCAGSEAFVEGQGDLNSKTVKQGDVIHLYYTKSVFPDNRAVTGITFSGTQDGAIGKNGGTTGYDLNSNAEGDFIYMHVTTAALPYAPGVSYLDPTDPAHPEKLCTDFTVITDQTTLTSGWYVVAGAITNGSRITVSGDVNLILTDGAELAANSGITVDRNDSVTNSLTIWAQSTDAVAGKLTARGGDIQAGIGGVNHRPGGVVTVNGGTVTARGGAGGAGIGGGWEGAGGAVTVNGGMVTAKGDWNGAGIGGGSQGAGGTVTVNGGKVTANGGTNAAGIGGGNYGGGGAVTVNGGMVEANGGVNAAGIGGGADGAGGMVTVNGGSVEAHGGWDGAGIGGGHQGVGGEVTVNGGTVEAHGGDNGAGIGGGYCGWWGGTVTVNGGTVTAHGGDASAGIGGGDAASGGTVTVNGGTVEAHGGGGGAAIGGGDGGGDGLLSITGMKVGYVESDGEVHEWAAPGNRDGYCRNREEKTVRIEVCLPHVFEGGICKICGEKALYLDPTDPAHPEKLCTDFTVITDQTTLTSGWYVVAGAITIDSRITVSGDVNLILMDRAELAANEGITVEEGNSLTIWAQSTDAVAGKLTAQGSAWRQAGIGGVNWTPCGAVTINGGTVEAHGGADAAGIGGGYYGAGGEVTVNGGSVEAHGATNGAGIGGGQNGVGGEVTVNGGTVEAHGGQYGAGIGGGYQGAGGVVTVNGGSVEAHGGTNAAGIGGGDCGVGGEVTVNGGTVEAKGGTNAAGIGGGDYGGWNDGSLSIDDGMRVGYVEADGKVHEWAECGDRDGYCRNRESKTVRIEVCDPHVDDDNNHFCDICGFGCLAAGEYFKATLAELGYNVPTDGTPYTVKAYGLPAGLKLKYNAAVTKKVKVKGKWKKVVVKAAKSEWWIEGVPTAAMDYWTNPAYLVIAANGVTTTEPLPIEVLAQDVTELGTFPVGTVWNAESPLYLPGVTNGWTVSGLPSGLKYTSKLVTKANKKGKKVVSVTTNALPYSVYGKVKAAGLFTITAKKKKGAYYATMKYRMLVTPKAVTDTAVFGEELTNITTMAYVPVEWDLTGGSRSVATETGGSRPLATESGSAGGLALPVVSNVVKVAGLPKGVAFAASTAYKDKKKKQVKQYGQTIVGTPTKPGTYVVTFTKNVKSGKKTVAKTAQILWKVVPNDAEVELGFNTAGGVIEGGSVGLKYGDLLAFSATSNAMVKASGLPKGIKLVRVDGSAGGLAPPGEAVWGFAGFTAKAGTYLVTVTATLNGNSVTQRLALKVDGLPAHAKGSFYGKTFTSPINVTGSNFSLNMTNVVGLSTMGVTSAGKISGKFQVYGTNWTFSAGSWAWMDEWHVEDNVIKRNEAFGTLATARYSYRERVKVKGKWKTVTRTLTKTLEVNVDGSGVLVHDPVDGVSAYLHQDLWGSTYKKVGKKVFVTGKKKYKVYQYTVDVEGVSCPLTVKVTTAGKATVTLKWNTGKKKKGKWVYYTPSCSTVVYPTGGSVADPDNFTGEVNYYFAPNANGFPGVGGWVQL